MFRMCKEIGGCILILQGLWLVWRYEGSKTLLSYLKARDTLQRIAKDMDVTEVQAGLLLLGWGSAPCCGTDLQGCCRKGYLWGALAGCGGQRTCLPSCFRWSRLLADDVA